MADTGIDLTALNTTPDVGQPSSLPPMEFPGMGDLNANVASAETARGDAQQSLDATIADVPQSPQPEQFNEQPPQRNIQQLMQLSPWLIMLGALGGSRTSLSGQAMLGATNGMIQGLTKGDEEGYQQAYQKYQDEHQKFAELQKQKWDVYREMVKVYKDRIDGKQRALQVAEQAVRDARKDRADTMMAYMQTVRAGVQLKDLNRKIADTESNITHRKEQDRIRQEEADRKAAKDAQVTGKASDKKAAHAKAVQDASSEIDQLISMLNTDKYPLTGVGGMVRRGAEAVGNVTGVSDSTNAATFESRLSNLQLAVAPVLASSNRTAKDQREKIDKVVRGLKPGDTRQNTIQALKDLKKLVGETEADTGDNFEPGKVYKNARGEQGRYLGDGKWQRIQTQ